MLLCKMRLITLSSLVSVIHFVNVPTVEADDAITLATQWAPRIVFHKDETIFPLSIETFLENTQCSELNSAPVPALPTGPSSYPYYLSTKTDKEILLNNQSSVLYGLNPKENSVPMYAAITPCSTNDHFIVTYYAFFGFKEGLEMCSMKFGNMDSGVPVSKIFNKCFGGTKRHFIRSIGDFQRITIEIKNQSARRLALSVHNVTVRYKYSYRLFNLDDSMKKGDIQVKKLPSFVGEVNGHPILYAAKHSHALYGIRGYNYGTDNNYRIDLLTSPKDETGFGVHWNTWNDLNAFYTDQAPDWFNYDGKWGNPKSECTGALKSLGVEEVCEYVDGPRRNRELDINCNE